MEKIGMESRLKQKERRKGITEQKEWKRGEGLRWKARREEKDRIEWRGRGRGMWIEGRDKDKESRLMGMEGKRGEWGMGKEGNNKGDR